MSKKINTTSLGLFIVAGAGLGVAGLLLFSSSRLFSRTLKVIVYFDETLNGLHEGAPVKYRGVTIGSVKRVMIRFAQATNDYAMPAILEIEQKLLYSRLDDPLEGFSEEALGHRINLGLRASLQTESLVTGVLYVDIRLDPAAPPAVFHQVRKVYPELPTEPTQIQALMSNLASLDVKGIETNLNALLIKLDAVIGGLHIQQIDQGVTNLLASLNRLASSPELSNDVASIHTTLETYRLLGEKLNNRVDPLADSITNSLAEADRALAQLRGATENLRTLLAPDASLRNDLDLALQQLASAGQSISALMEFLKLYPNALITGRQTSGKTK